MDENFRPRIFSHFYLKSHKIPITFSYVVENVVQILISLLCNTAPFCLQSFQISL
jgi:hypothetical protein